MHYTKYKEVNRPGENEDMRGRGKEENNGVLMIFVK